MTWVLVITVRTWVVPNAWVSMIMESSFLKRPKISVVPTETGRPRRCVKGEKNQLTYLSTPKYSIKARSALPKMSMGHAMTINSLIRYQDFFNVFRTEGN